MKRLLHEGVQAARGLARRPGLTTVAVLTLAVGIGGATSIFSVADAVVLRPLPYADPERLVVIWQRDRDRSPFAEISYPAFREWRDRSQLFESLAAIPSVNWEMTLTGHGEPTVIEASAVSGVFFQLLGIAPALGRPLLPEDDQPGATVVVLSHALWRDRFGADPHVIGQPLVLDGRSFTIVGVMPAGVVYPKGAGVWIPLPASDGGHFDDFGIWWLIALGRLKPDVTIEAASAELSMLWRETHRAMMPAGIDPGMVELLDRHTAVLTPLADTLLGPTRPALLAILGASLLVLLISCANVAGLLVVRATERHREMAIRQALGARRGQLMGLVFGESVMLAVLGAGAGTLAALAGTPLLAALSPADVPRLEDVAINTRAIGFAVAAAALVAIFSALAPMMLVRRATFANTVGHAPSRIPGGRSRFRAALVVSEVALAVVLLTAAGLLVRSFINLGQVPLGFEPERVLTLTVTPKGERYADLPARRGFHQEMLQRVQALPGVESAAVMTRRPLWSTIGYDWIYTIEGQTDQEAARNPHVNLLSVSPDYFRTMGIRLLRGRAFTEGDREGQPGVVIVSDSLARRAWPRQDPIGQRLKIPLPDTPYHDVWLTVVGVAAEARYRELETARLDLYMSYLQLDHPLNSLMVRASIDPAVMAPAIREAVHGLDPNVPVTDATPMADLVARALGGPRFAAHLFGAFAILALALASLGLYGLLACSVASRTREMGLRIALGARAADVRWLVVGQGLRLTLTGLLAGVTAAVSGGALVEALLYGITARDPLTLVVAPAVLTTVAILACLAPAIRATRVDPAIALRDE